MRARLIDGKSAKFTIKSKIWVRSIIVAKHSTQYFPVSKLEQV